MANIEIDDLLLQIFVCLPLYSIQQFITANRQWHSLINNPTFRSEWRKRNLKRSRGLIIRSRVPTKTYLLPFLPNTQMTPVSTIFRVKQSSNGLLLCLSRNKYHVCNPVTNMHRTLPELGEGVIVPGSTRIRTMSLAYDPLRYGPHYKVICFVGYRYGNEVKQVYVYSSESRVWNLAPANVGFVQVNDKGVYWNRCIHWMLELTYFNVQTETFHNMPEPPTGGSLWRKNYYLGESCGRLNLTKLWKTTEGLSLGVDVFELRRDYSEWVVRYRIELGNPYFVNSVLSVVHGAEEEDSFIVFKTEGAILQYKLVPQTHVELLSTWAGGVFDTAFQYIESCSGV